jgi:hypothetical protein
MSDDNTAYALRLVKAQALRDAAEDLRNTAESHDAEIQGPRTAASWLERRASRLEQR